MRSGHRPIMADSSAEQLRAGVDHPAGQATDDGGHGRRFAVTRARLGSRIELHKHTEVVVGLVAGGP